MSRASRLRLLCVGLLAGCLDAPVGIAPPPAPVIDAVAAASPHNVLSAVVTVTARKADSVAVQMHTTVDDSITPAMPLVGGAASIPSGSVGPSTGAARRIGHDVPAEIGTRHYRRQASRDKSGTWSRPNRAGTPGTPA